MANNRMYLKCKQCNETLLIGKTLGTGYYTPPVYDKILEGKLDIFFNEHDICSIENENCFELEYERKEVL